MRIDADKVLARRREERRQLIARAEELAGAMNVGLGVMAVVVYGSVARGDFNVWSDVDVLVVARNLPERPLDRVAALGTRPPLVHPLAWTPEEYRDQLARGNAAAREAHERGLWLVGKPTDLT